MISNISSITGGECDELNATETSRYTDFSNSYIDPYWHQFPKVSREAHYFMGSVLLIIGLVGMAGNGLVIWIFTRYRQCKSPSNMLIVNLAVSDFLMSLLHPFPSYASFMNCWTLGQLACELYAAGTGFTGLMSIVTLTAISIERFTAIYVKPFTSRWVLTYRSALKTIVIIWLYCLALMLPPFFGWGKFVLEGFLTSCTFDYLTRTVSNRNFMIYLFFFGFFVPVGCIVVCYIGILIVVYQHEKEMKKTLGGIRRQNVSQQRDKKLDTKTAKIIFTLIMLFLISWSPYAMVTLLAQFGSDKFRVTPWMSSLPALFAKSSTIYNPIIYGISHPIFRKGLKRFLTGDERRLSRRGTSSRRVTSLRMSEYRLNKEPMHTTTKCHSQKY